MTINDTNYTAPVVGFANNGTLCSDSAVAVVYDDGESIASTASLAAHELGHLMNLQHDERELIERISSILYYIVIIERCTNIHQSTFLQYYTGNFICDIIL